MKTFASILILGLTLSLSASADMLQKKSGTFIEGKILEITEKGVRIQLVEGGEATIPFDDLDPFTVYKIRDGKLRKTGDADPGARFALGRYAMEAGLYDIGRADMDAAVKKDPTLKSEADKVIADVEDRDSAHLYEAGTAAMKVQDYSGALMKFQTLVDFFPASKYVEEAKKALAAATAEIEKENAKKKELLDALTKKKVDAKAAKVEEGVKGKMDAAVKAYEDARKFNGDALEAEGNTSVSKADKNWRAAESALFSCKDLVIEIASGTKDVDVLGSAKKLDADCDALLVIVYGNLGHLWAVERYYKEATKWLNRALAMDPTNHFATEVKLLVAAQQIRRSYSPERDR
jgi:tetratricopeptide (TPR) repeat protein